MASRSFTLRQIGPLAMCLGLLACSLDPQPEPPMDDYIPSGGIGGNGKVEDAGSSGKAGAAGSHAGTGGFSGDTSDWAHAVVRDAKGKWLVLHLTAGEHTVKMTNLDGKGMNLDYVALMPAKK